LVFSIACIGFTELEHAVEICTALCSINTDRKFIDKIIDNGVKMNKYIKVIAVLIMLFSAQYGHSMQRVPAVLSRGFTEHEKMREYIGPSPKQCARMGISKQEAHFFKKQSVKLMTDRFNAEKCKPHNPELKQAKLFMEENPGAAYHILSHLFNGNTALANICLDKPIEEVMMRYADAQDLRSKYPISVFKDGSLCGVEYYILLTEKEAETYFRVLKDKFYYNEIEADLFVSACEKIQRVNPTLKCDKKTTDQIKLYPSLKERTGLFLSFPDNFFVNTTMWTGVPMGIGMFFGGGCTIPSFSSYAKAVFASYPLMLIMGAKDRYPIYKNNLEWRLVSQPSLTKVLCEKAAQTRRLKHWQRYKDNDE
jgi:hypothetical protein